MLIELEVPPATHRPALVDGRLVWLPLLPGLLAGARGFEAAGNRPLWSALAAAAIAGPALERLDDVVDVDDVFPLGTAR